MSLSNPTSGEGGQVAPRLSAMVSRSWRCTFPAGRQDAHPSPSSAWQSLLIPCPACMPLPTSMLGGRCKPLSPTTTIYPLPPPPLPPPRGRRVYAYTTSAVQVAILRTFVRCDALLPNLFVGTITRDSATAALALGITANQMADFLRQHAHPRVATKHPIVPAVSAGCALSRCRHGSRRRRSTPG